eukprot:CAMPEP_0174376258 /NCGR_PEP_ID=MMETSP0811_2-20130205/117548_1 /TAXON_ID=73025 ORGANISM="Eutreptiella gymnastica-like, Strain CCMP1594" /NCGR_SAMPLE_ID=MMETSP0811_2 /ASSEMBLY_ACC=CAM_ASM_000667 /LENGTH=86 /DNA_ID=CAMNT_0015527253 /DNA_START=444 /DNA_END=701 /DNA_ORIENTATION=-
MAGTQAQAPHNNQITCQPPPPRHRAQSRDFQAHSPRCSLCSLIGNGTSAPWAHGKPTGCCSMADALTSPPETEAFIPLSLDSGLQW